jgi:hypothetical protein
MNFNKLYNILFEHSKQDVLTHETLVRYYYYHIGPNEKDAKAIDKYLKRNNIDRRWAMVVTDTGLDAVPEKDYYFFLIAKVMNKGERAKQMKNIVKLVSADAGLRITQYGEYPAEDIESGSQYEYNYMAKYNLDDETKETWKDVLPEL